MKDCIGNKNIIVVRSVLIQGWHIDKFLRLKLWISGKLNGSDKENESFR
jgi:hypothetical protein